MKLSILLVVLMLFFSFPSFFYGDAEAQDESADDGGAGAYQLLIILAILGILTYFLVLLRSSTTITGKLTLILLIFWTFFWILVAGVPVVNGDLEGSIGGIIVYIIVGIPSTLFGWFLWLGWSPEEKSPNYTMTRRNMSKIGSTGITPLGKILRRGRPPIMGKFKRPFKRTVGKQQLMQKSKMEPILLRRCGNMSCRMEKFLVTEADGHQHCTECKWSNKID